MLALLRGRLSVWRPTPCGAESGGGVVALSGLHACAAAGWQPPRIGLARPLFFSHIRIEPLWHRLIRFWAIVIVISWPRVKGGEAGAYAIDQAAEVKFVLEELYPPLLRILGTARSSNIRCAHALMRGEGHRVRASSYLRACLRACVQYVRACVPTIVRVRP